MPLMLQPAPTEVCKGERDLGFRVSALVSASLPLCLSASLPLCLSVSLSLCLSVSLSLPLSLSLSLSLSRASAKSYHTATTNEENAKLTPTACAGERSTVQNSRQTHKTHGAEASQHGKAL